MFEKPLCGRKVNSMSGDERTSDQDVLSHKGESVRESKMGVGGRVVGYYFLYFYFFLKAVNSPSLCIFTVKVSLLLPCNGIYLHTGVHAPCSRGPAGGVQSSSHGCTVYLGSPVPPRGVWSRQQA